MAPWEITQITGAAAVVLIEALSVIVSIPIFYRTGITFAWVSILIGIVGTFLSGRNNQLVRIDFTHLSERAMLYVVFTFGEMIIAIAGYFENGFGMNTMFFSGMAFLIVAGLFLCYGTLYDHVIDRERETNGTGYMMIHVFLIFALNNITTALEFMREEKIALLPKTLK